MANVKLSTKAVGSIVKLKVNGAAKEFIVVHQGKPGSMYDESCNGTWLLMKDIYENRQWDSSNVNKYESSDIHTYLNNTFLNLFESNIRDVIKQVKIPYRKNGGSGGQNQSGANGLSCKVFLLSGPEVGLAGASYMPNDGAKLDYFNANIETDSKRIAYLNGSAAFWWLRSPHTNYSSDVGDVLSDGGLFFHSAYNSYGIRPALILPQDMEVDSSGNVTPPPPATHKTLVNGTAYEVKSGKCLVNGTAYSIKKGRTLIDGTGYDITFPAPLVMPAKGDLITMNLDGTDRQYRVLKIVDDTTVEVLTMWNVSTSSMFGSNNTYSENTLDTYLNSTWYNSLSSAAKAAIVPKNITQDSWYWGSAGSPLYSGTYGNTAPGSSSYTIGKSSDNYATIGSRYVYAMSIQEVLDYLSDKSVLVDTSGMLRNQNIWKMFWNQTTTIAEYPWLRSANAQNSTDGWAVFGAGGMVGFSSSDIRRAVRGSFQIDLSKIDFTIGGGSVSKTWTFNSTVNSPTSTPTILYANFTSNGTKFKAFNCDVMAGALNLSYLYLNQDASHTQLNVYYYNWQNEAYRTVIFDEAPSGDLLIWLQANATPQ